MPDPVSAWRASAVLVERGFKDATKRVRHPVGEIPAHQLLFFRCSDTLVHAWDLERALGRDVRLDSTAVSACLDILEPIALLLPATGMYGPPVTVGAAADDQTRLLALAGRAA
jgi:uncharacterized protein (TIGR03086 family)